MSTVSRRCSISDMRFYYIGSQEFALRFSDRQDVNINRLRFRGIVHSASHTRIVMVTTSVSVIRDAKVDDVVRGGVFNVSRLFPSFTRPSAEAETTALPKLRHQVKDSFGAGTTRS